jgi:lipopolysaccharide transport system ATP-binding protein
MYVRLAFAVAAHLESEILIVDEVLAVGDAEFQKKCLGKMGEVSKGEGRTVLFVSHNMAAVSSLCSSVLLFENGINKFHGNTNLGLDHYLSKSQYSITNIASVKLIKADFELEGVSMLQNEIPRTEFTTKDSINIVLHYHLKNSFTGFRIGFDLVDSSNDTVIFRTYHDDMNLVINETIAGEYNSILELPSFLLKEGCYVLTLLVGIHNIKWISKDEFNIPFSVLNTGGINQIYADVRPGVIMPLLKWETKLI